MANGHIHGHIERLREKPEHVRHTIAMGTAFVFTGLVAVGWMTAMATSGTLALKPSAPVNDGAGAEVAKTVTESTTAFSSLLGAAGAAFTATSTDAALDIIESETRTSSTLNANQTSANATTKTVIPF